MAHADSRVTDQAHRSGRGDRTPCLVSALAALLIGAFVLGALWLAPPRPGMRAVADLPQTDDVAARKRLFLEFLRPVVQAENARLRAQRARLLDWLSRFESAGDASGGEAGGGDHAWLARMAERYRVEAGTPRGQARGLKQRLDIIPESLALAQAALESAWGESRFARQANNLFGEWCFTPGCGVVPRQRPAGRDYEVKAFTGVGGSVRSYMHNLNSHPSYLELRRIRERARAAGREPDGYEMAGGLQRYAAIGQRYVHQIRGVIEHNGLR